jgi:eukaryotic-like serine/threonine-protein kinase
MSEKSSDKRLRCPVCLSIFRTPYDCCPADGAELITADGDPLIGTEIAGRHIIDELIGEGSMGIIYRAHHVHLPRWFAVKILFGDLVSDQRMRIRFAQEAALASQLSHPNVVSVVDFGRSERGLLYLVMDYIEGETMADFIAREAPLSPLRAIKIARQLAQGLGHAHEAGLVHRDFKPGNVMMERNDDGPPVPRILDFGLAISTTEREDNMAGRLTEYGYIVGTPIYMAPEQALDRKVDHRADLFALGVTMYEMLAGKPPFDGRPVEIAHKNVTQAPPHIAQRSPGVVVPPDLERVVRRLLEKSPDHRFESATAVCAALDAIERTMMEGKTEAMAILDRHDRSDRAEILGEPDYSLNLDWPAGAPRRRHRLAALGALLFAAGAVVYALADRSGMIGVSRLEAQATAEASTPAKPVAQAAVNAAAAPAQQPVPVVAPLASARPEKLPTSTARESQGSVTHAARSPQARRRPAAELAEDRASREDRASWREAYVEPETPDVDEVPAEEPPSAPVTAESEPPPAENLIATPIEPPASGEEPGSSAPPAATVRAPTRPAPRRSEPPVDQLVREYREVGEAIARLEASRGERAVRGLRNRYFRLPYSDALRIVAVRRDTLVALASLRRAVEATMQRISVDASSVPAG